MPHSTIFFFFFNDTATTEIYTLSLHDALPIFGSRNAILLDHLVAPLPDLLLRQPFFREPMAALDDLVGVRGDAVRGRVRADLERAADADDVARRDAEDLDVVEARVGEPLPHAQDLAEPVGRFGRHPDAAA